jgi:pimeloyl-ACP methyl ester carboxylesterase
MTDARARGHQQVWRSISGICPGPRVVLIHGSLDRSAGLLRLARRLDRRYCVARYDRRGYGRSQRLGGPYDVETHLGDLEGLLDGAPAMLFGHSFGGVLALAAAARLGPSVTGVVVYEPPLVWEPWWPRATGLDQEQPEEVAEAFMRRLIGDHRWERLGSSTRQARRAEGLALVAELDSLNSGRPFEPGSLGCPVLVMRGSEAREHHVRACDRLVAEIEDSSLVVIEGAGHFGPNTHPDLVAAAVEGFATENALGTGGRVTGEG